MPTLSWCESTTAAVPHPVRVERFCGKTRHRVHLLGEVRQLKVHYRLGENTVPCLDPEQPCPFCGDLMWKPRFEHFGPALMMDPKEGQWKQIVAVFTQGGWNQLYKAPPGPHRGRLLDISRVSKGNAGGGVLVVKEVSRIDPNYPAFDVLPHLIRCWFPFSKDLPPVDALPPVPVVAYEPAPQQPAPVPVKLSPEVLAQFHDFAKQFGGGVRQDGTNSAAPGAAAEQTEPLPPPPPPVTSVPAPAAATPPADATMRPAPRRHPSVLSPEDEAEMLRRRAARNKPADQLTGAEAVDVGRVLDFVLADTHIPATVPYGSNGKVKGGAR